MDPLQKERLEEIVNKLYDIGGLKFGNFVMKSGQTSPVYVDLRVLISYPELLESIALLMWELKGENLKHNSVCGVPYTALPIATVISVRNHIPMLIRRKEAKQYGTKKLIEGNIKAGDQCVIIEDVVTSGSSVLETVKDLQQEGLNVTDAIVIVDREQGGRQGLADNGITLHSLCTLMQIMDILMKSGKIDQVMVDKVKTYLKDNQPPPKHNDRTRLTLKYEARAALAKSCVAEALLKLMAEKKSNLCVAADVTTAAELVSLAQTVGPYICLLKTHADTISNFTADVADELIDIALKYHFMILEDRKFADIGSVVAKQYSGGRFEISRWADLVTAHALPGDGLVRGLQEGAKKSTDVKRGCFLLAEMSCAGNLITPEYAQGAVSMAKQWPDMIVGLVCQSPLAADCSGLVQLTPGVRRGVTQDHLGQQWVSSEEAVLTRGADVVVVGRGITSANNIADEAKAYQEELWAAYEKRTSNSRV